MSVFDCTSSDVVAVHRLSNPRASGENSSIASKAVSSPNPASGVAMCLPGFDVKFTSIGPVAQFANFLLQSRGLTVCFAQAQILIHFQVQFDKQLPGLLHGRQVVNGEAQNFVPPRESLRIGARPEVRVVPRAPSHLPGTISPMRFSMASLKACTCSRLAVLATLTVASTKWRFPAAAPARDRHPAAIHARHSLGYFLLQPLRRRVQQGIQRASAELRAHPQNDGPQPSGPPTHRRNSAKGSSTFHRPTPARCRR